MVDNNLPIGVPDNGDPEPGFNAIPSSSYNIRFPNREPAEVVAVGSGGAGYDDTIEVSDDYSLVP